MCARICVCIAVLFFCWVGNGGAATLLVDNNWDHDADYRTLQAAVDGASAGDTIILAGSGTSYGNATVTKRLNIYGNGYYLEENGLGEMAWESPVGDITFSEIIENNIVMATSDGSVLAGVNMSSSDDWLKIERADNITIKRNRISRIGIGDNGTYTSIGINIYRNYIHYYFGIYINRLASANIHNNIIRGRINVLENATVIIKNNIITGSDTDEIFFYDNSDGEAVNNIVTEIILYEGSFATFHDNYITTVYDMENNLFVWNSSPDGKYDFKTNSPALGACQDGADCGAFGGTTPYLLSGIPARPRVTLVQSPGTVVEGQTGMSVKVTAEGRN